LKLDRRCNARDQEELNSLNVPRLKEMLRINYGSEVLSNVPVDLGSRVRMASLETTVHKQTRYAKCKAENLISTVWPTTGADSSCTKHQLSACINPNACDKSVDHPNAHCIEIEKKPHQNTSKHSPLRN
jgi:hypothetical protein